jgi:hypothetical protein
MPDHVHLLHDVDARRPLGRAMAAYGLWWSHRNGERWPGVTPIPDAQPVLGRQKQQRSLRYVHLNPCRAGLCQDPLAWPLSTHRDAVGLCALPLVDPRRNPAQFHTYVSADPTTAVQGTPMPAHRLGIPHLRDVHAAVSATTRTPTRLLGRAGPARDLFIAAAREFTPASIRAVGALIGVSHATVLRAAPAPRRSLAVVERVLGDPRFEPLGSTDLRVQYTWRRYG